MRGLCWTYAGLEGGIDVVSGMGAHHRGLARRIFCSGAGGGDDRTPLCLFASPALTRETAGRAALSLSLAARLHETLIDLYYHRDNLCVYRRRSGRISRAIEFTSPQTRHHAAH